MKQQPKSLRSDIWRAGRPIFAEFDARVKDGINHVLYADS